MTTTFPWPLRQAVRAMTTCSGIVDIGGVDNAKTGSFHLVENAIAAGHRAIYVRDGTYPGTVISGTGIYVRGESLSGAIFDGALNAAHGVDISGTLCRIENLTAKLAAGGGIGKDSFHISGNKNTLACCTSDDNDQYAIYSWGSYNQIFGNRIDSAGDDHKLFLNGTGDIATQNSIITSGSGIGIYITGDKNIVAHNWFYDSATAAAGADSNVIHGNSSWGSMTNSGSGNELTGNSVVW